MSNPLHMDESTRELLKGGSGVDIIRALHFMQEQREATLVDSCSVKSIDVIRHQHGIVMGIAQAIDLIKLNMRL